MKTGHAVGALVQVNNLSGTVQAVRTEISHSPKGFTPAKIALRSAIYVIELHRNRKLLWDKTLPKVYYTDKDTTVSLFSDEFKFLND